MCLYKYLETYFNKQTTIFATGWYLILPSFVFYNRFAWNPNPIPLFFILFVWCLTKFNETQKIKSSKFYLEYFKVNEFDYVNYYFFDPKFKIYIGFLNVEETRPNKLFPRNTYKVSLSMIETTLIGQGYGKSMYLSVIDDVDCLLSDEYLYKGSANIWINVLWRYYESVGFYDRNWQEYLKLPLQYDRNWADRVAYFFASKNPDLIKKLLKYNTKNRR